jgi:NAD(P)-dependent dehydrogenase (short-subunit alcohol dehydrogenase family)
MSGTINYNGFSLDETPALDKQTGIGKEMAGQLLVYGILKVYVLVRGSQKFDTTIEYWKETHQLGYEDTSKTVQFMPCNLSDIRVVKKVADDLIKMLGRLDILVGNAGQWK